MDIELNDLEYTINCLICNGEIKNSIRDYEYCNNCFHTSKVQGNKFTEVQMFKSNIKDGLVNSRNGSIDESIKKCILKVVSDVVSDVDTNKSNYKILVLNDGDTKLIDSISDTLLKKISKYDLKTVSVSPFYNSSFFSKHKHYKLVFTEYTVNLLRDEYEYFDIILLNDTLTYMSNPVEILGYCNSLSHSDTKIISFNLFTEIFYSLELVNMDKNISNIFNCNSLQLACSKAGLHLENLESVIEQNVGWEEESKDKHDQNNMDDCWYISEMCVKTPNIQLCKKICERLYKEIEMDLYDYNTYDDNRIYWDQYFNDLNHNLSKYNGIGYNIVLITNISQNKKYSIIKHDKNITIDCISKIDTLCESDYNLLVILDYKNTKMIKDKIIESSKRFWMFYDLYNSIGYDLKLVS